VEYEDDITEVISKKGKVQPDEVLSGLLTISKNESRATPNKKYYTITQLCNPMEAYVKSLLGTMIIPPELQKKFDIGNKIHSFAENRLEKYDGFVSSESTLDGNYMVVNAVGKIDVKISQSIIDLKTKPELPKDINELLVKYPQDMEQLAFYALLDPTKPTENYLIFISQSDYTKVKSFKITIKDFGGVKNLIKKRINNLTKVFGEKSSPEILGKCRYCNGKEKCHMCSNDSCKWESLDEVLCEVKDFIKIEEDSVYSDWLSEAMQKWDGSDFIYLYDLITPRKKLLSNHFGRETRPANLFKGLNKTFANKKVFDLKKKSSIEGIPPENEFEGIYSYKNNWFNYKTSMYPEGKLLPYIVHVVNSPNPKNLVNPSPYKVSELGLLVAINKKTKGILFQYYPNVDNKFRAFIIDYNFDGTLKGEILESAKIIKENDLSNLSNLRKCPVFMCSSCGYREECNKYQNKIV
jgi:hypothetical protein